MRTLAVGEVAQWPAPKLKVEIENGSGTYIDYSAFIPVAGAASMGESVDTPVATGTIALRRRNNAGDSLSPLMGESALNVDDDDLFSPAIDLGRGIRISAAKNGTATYRELFVGRINRVDWSQDPISVGYADLGAWLMDAQIKVEGIEYGTTPVGTALEVVIQNIVDATPSGKGTPGLYTPVSPGFLVTAWAQGRVKVLEAIRDIALQSTGWDVRFRYDASHVSRLTLLDPQRDRTTVDATISSYRAIRALDLDIKDIRNSGLVPYTDADGIGHTIPDSDDASILKYGERYFELPSSESIDTEAEASALLAAVVHDLADALAELTVELDFFWPVQLYDRYTFPANGRHFDDDQTFAVSAYQHSFDGGHGITTLTLSGRVVGAYASWLPRVKARLPNDNRCILSNIQRTDTDTDSTISWTPGPDVAEVWAAYAVKDAPEQDGDWPAVAALVYPLADGVRSLTVPRPTDQQITMVQLEPHRADLSVGIVKRLVITATPQVPTWEPDDLETATTGTQWLSFTERGIAIVAVDMQTQVGTNPISAIGPPTRGPGDASTVKGVPLGAFEYEFDVPLDATRQSWIVVGYTLSNGTRIGMPPFGFDRDKLPNLLSIVQDPVTPTKLTITGDSDTKSIGIYSSYYSYGYEADGNVLEFDRARPGNLPTFANLGLASGFSDLLLIRAWAVPIVALTGNHVNALGSFSDLVDEKPLAMWNSVGAGGSGAPDATWLQVFGYGPGGDGSQDITIYLEASSAPAGWSVVLAIDEDGGIPETDETANVSPTLSVPPVTLTAYTWTSSYARVPRDDTTRLITLRLRADLVDNVGQVRDTRSTTVGWYTPSTEI
jgi:hypothetical protein